MPSEEAFMPSDDGFYAERRSALCQVSLITDKAMGTTCITESCLMESSMFMFELFGVEFC